jgi:hypothetical protein
MAEQKTGSVQELEEVACRVCRCTETAACPGGCWWVPDPEMLGDICSSCACELVDIYDESQPDDDLDPCNYCPHDNTRHRGDGCLDCGCVAAQ